MHEDLSILLTSFNIGKETIKNRFVFGPIGDPNFFDSRSGFSERTIEYFTERAKGGFGLIMTGAIMCDMIVDPFDPKAGGRPLYAPSHFIDTANRLNERCNTYGAKVFVELGFGAGRNHLGLRAPSAVEVYGYPDRLGIEMTIDEIHKKRDQFIQTAAMMKQCGFAGIDIHTLHWGYLLDEFAMAITNHREDEYGGSLENRLRIVKELIQGIQQVCGTDYPITIGLACKSYIKALNKASLTGEEEAGRTVEEAVRIAKMLEQMGIAAIMTDTGIYDSFYYACPPSYMPKGHGLKHYEEIKRNVSIPIMARSRMGDPYLCAHAIKDGQADAVVLARPALADPYFPRKVEMGIPHKIRPCIGCNLGCVGYRIEKNITIQCAVNPRAYAELTTRPKQSIRPQKIAIVGGGVAGMQAALTAADCGHKAVIYEKSAVLGGELNSAGAHATKQEIYQLRDWFIRELEERQIPIYLNTTFQSHMAKDQGFDTVILATGASSIMPSSMKGIGKAISAVDFLEGKKTVGEHVIIVGGGMVGIEIAVELAKAGKHVILVEMLEAILSHEFVPQQHKMMLHDMLEHYNVEIITSHKLVEILDYGALIESMENSKQRSIKADDIIIAMGLAPDKFPVHELYGNNISIYEIGSARKVGNIIQAIHDAFEVVYHLD